LSDPIAVMIDDGHLRVVVRKAGYALIASLCLQ